ncbi:hypothetical protein VT52_012620 [Streptomyces malaysiense]|uniref:Uncharacterized protein n=1 Tax=Streptomyces malaysiense TaxID=1428626 RepID=A0A1J4Q280_9ACTN|nr:hypothetical protein VT52_012620 [Streptomyces malaysiense]
MRRPPASVRQEGRPRLTTRHGDLPGVRSELVEQRVIGLAGEPQQVGHQVLAQRTAGAVVHQRHVTAAQQSAGIAHRPMDRAVDRGCEVVVRGH